MSGNVNRELLDSSSGGLRRIEEEMEGRGVSVGADCDSVR